MSAAIVAAVAAVLVAVMGGLTSLLIRRLDNKTSRIEVNVDGNLAKAMERIERLEAAAEAKDAAASSTIASLADKLADSTPKPDTPA